MKLAEYGWVSDESSLVSWENGMKWLSKAIVSDNNEMDKQELKHVLEEHLRAGFVHPANSIRQVAVFYSLCWKRMDLIDEFWNKIGTGDLLRYLNDALSRMYSNYSDYGDRFFRFSGPPAPGMSAEDLRIDR